MLLSVLNFYQCFIEKKCKTFILKQEKIRSLFHLLWLENYLDSSTNDRQWVHYPFYNRSIRLGEKDVTIANSLICKWDSNNLYADTKCTTQNCAMPISTRSVQCSTESP